jgi:hypothetical protein
MSFRPSRHIPSGEEYARPLRSCSWVTRAGVVGSVGKGRGLAVERLDLGFSSMASTAEATGGLVANGVQCGRALVGMMLYLIVRRVVVRYLVKTCIVLYYEG